MNDFPTIQSIVLAARQNLSDTDWDFVTFGTESETTVLRNRQALDSLGWRPRIMRDVSMIDCSTSLLGRTMRIPVLLSPVGSIARFDPNGLAVTAAAVDEFGVLQFASAYADVLNAKGVDFSSVIFAFNPTPDPSALEDVVDRVNDGGFAAISVASQSAYYSRRERDIVNGFAAKFDQSRGYAWHHRQQREQIARGETPTKEGLKNAAISWELFDRVKSRSKLPVILKGVVTAEDAKLAVEHGCDMIYVSNNGGRGLDHMSGAISILPEIVAAVDGKVDVVVDGGFVRGSDVLKAIALGAKAVSMGRMQAWALAAGGRGGLLRMLELIEEEIVITMGQLGVTSLSELTPDYLGATTPVTAPHPLSAFPMVREKIEDMRLRRILSGGRSGG